MKENLEFRYQELPVRVTTKQNEIWFVAKDICDILELTNSRMAIQSLDEDEKGVSDTDTLGGSQEVNIISESGLYHLIFKSQKPEAREFRRWVTHEVLPSIRRTGYYATPKGMKEIAAAQRETARLLNKNANNTLMLATYIAAINGIVGKLEDNLAALQDHATTLIESGAAANIYRSGTPELPYVHLGDD